MTTIVDKFREAIAWGAVYGPEIPPHQWDEMRDSMAEQFASELTVMQCEHVWRVMNQGVQWMDCRCDKCGTPKRETWD